MFAAETARTLHFGLAKVDRFHLSVEWRTRQQLPAPTFYTKWDCARGVNLGIAGMLFKQQLDPLGSSSFMSKQLGCVSRCSPSLSAQLLWCGSPGCQFSLAVFQQGEAGTMPGQSHL